MGMSIEEACKYVFNGWAPGVVSYELEGNVIKLICKSNSGRTTYEGEVVIKNEGKNFTYACTYNSNTPYIFGSNVCQMMTEGKITH